MQRCINFLYALLVSFEGDFFLNGAYMWIVRDTDISAKVIFLRLISCQIGSCPCPFLVLSFLVLNMLCFFILTTLFWFSVASLDMALPKSIWSASDSIPMAITSSCCQSPHWWENFMPRLIFFTQGPSNPALEPLGPQIKIWLEHILTLWH